MRSRDIKTNKIQGPVDISADPKGDLCTYPSERLWPLQGSVTQLSESLPTPEKSNLSGQASAECLTLSPCNKVPSRSKNPLKLSVTAGSRQSNKETTLPGKSSTCDSSSRMQKLSQTSVLDLTSKERDLQPYWTDLCRVNSVRLLSPTEIVCAGSGLDFSSTLSTKMVENSWFSIDLKTPRDPNSYKTSFQSYTSSLVGCMDFDVTVVRSKKIRIYPTAEQRNLFRQWFGVQRLIYNKTVDYLKQPVPEGEKRPTWNLIANKILFEASGFCKEVPYQIKKIAVRDAVQALHTNIKKGKPFDLHFKSRKDQTQSCYIPKSAIKDRGIYYTLSGVLKFSEPLPEILLDSRLCCINDRWYLSVPYSKTVTRSENQGRITAIDPGNRCFATYFSEAGFGQIGLHDIGHIVRQCQHLDQLISKMSKADAPRRRRMCKACKRMRHKIKDLVMELHWKTIRFLTENFDVIIYPKFETSKMVLKATRKLKTKSVRSMLTYSFGIFQDRLENKCFETGRILIRDSEAWTSKTNSFDGTVMEDLGSKEFFNYNGLRINRDINGAGGIFLRALRDLSWVQENSLDPAFVGNYS